MKRIDSTGAVNGKWVDKNPATGVPGTTMQAAWFNAIQEELASVIESERIVLDARKQNQLLEAFEKKLRTVLSTKIQFTDKALFALPRMESNIQGQIIYSRIPGRQIKCQLYVLIDPANPIDSSNYWFLFLPDTVPEPEINENILNIDLTYNTTQLQQLQLRLISQGTCLFSGYPGAGFEVTPGVVSFAQESDGSRYGIALMPSVAMRSKVKTIVAEWSYTSQD